MERATWRIEGFTAIITLVIVACTIGLVALTGFLPVIVLLLPLAFMIKGFVVLEPGEAIVTTFFGSYSGSILAAGFHLINPLSARTRVSIKSDNLATPILKVNDANGNPIEIGASIVWQVHDTARAVFSVESFSNYMRVQAESALRQLANDHTYEGDDNDSRKSLRKNVETVTKELIAGINTVVKEAGLRVVDARISHLSYAPEIAQSMLRKQQAQQVIAAREQIVQGALKIVSEVCLALDRDNIVKLSEDHKSQLVINLLTVMMSENEAQPTLPLR